MRTFSAPAYVMLFAIDSVPFLVCGVLWWFILRVQGTAEYYAALIVAGLALLVIRRLLLPVRRFIAFHCCRLLVATGLRSFMEVAVWKSIRLADPFSDEADFGDRFYAYLADVYPGMRESVKFRYRDILFTIERTTGPHWALLARDVRQRIEAYTAEQLVFASGQQQESWGRFPTCPAQVGNLRH